MTAIVRPETFIVNSRVEYNSTCGAELVISGLAAKSFVLVIVIPIQNGLRIPLYHKRTHVILFLTLYNSYSGGMVSLIRTTKAHKILTIEW